jgi:pimeloyl-ACP methyl ester carboxylesterase
MNRFATIFLIAACLAGAGCESTYSRMKSELAIAPYDTLARRAAGMPNDTILVPTTRGNEPVVRVALHRTGNPRAEGPILVFIHGAFSDASAWRYLVGELGVDHTAWLIDLPGCGKSDWPAPSELAHDGYGPGALGERTYQAIASALATEPRDRPVVLIGHSLGAAVAIRMTSDATLADAFAQTRRRVAGMVLVTPLDVAIEKPIPVLEYVARLDGLSVGVGNSIGILRERMARGVMESYEDPQEAPREEVDRGVRIIATSGLRRATQAMILQATPRRPGQARPDWPLVDRLVEQYRNIAVPVRITCGAHDETFPASMSYKLAAQIPAAQLQVIPDCMHSPHLERPRICAAVIRDFLEQLPIARETVLGARVTGVREPSS